MTDSDDTDEHYDSELWGVLLPDGKEPVEEKRVITPIKPMTQEILDRLAKSVKRDLYCYTLDNEHHFLATKGGGHWLTHKATFWFAEEEAIRRNMIKNFDIYPIGEGSSATKHSTAEVKAAVLKYSAPAYNPLTTMHTSFIEEAQQDKEESARKDKLAAERAALKAENAEALKAEKAEKIALKEEIALLKANASLQKRTKATDIPESAYSATGKVNGTHYKPLTERSKAHHGLIHTGNNKDSFCVLAWLSAERPVILRYGRDTLVTNPPSMLSAILGFKPTMSRDGYTCYGVKYEPETVDKD